MKNHIKKIRNIVAVLMIITLVSCEKVIEIDLNSSNPVLVAEGVIDNESPAWIRLSYTTDYFETEQANVEQGATVTISDNAGHTETLEYVSDGLYQGNDLIGSADNKYTITILKDDEVYEANSKLFPPSEILSVNFEKNDSPRPGQDETYVITINFKDDPSNNNYYLIKYQTNGEVEEDVNTYNLIDDEYYENTGEIEYTPFRTNFELGDVIMIELYSINEETYIFYSELNDTGGGMMGGSSTPYTPKSNFGSDVLGYFAAWSKVEYQATVE